MTNRSMSRWLSLTATAQTTRNTMTVYISGCTSANRQLHTSNPCARVTEGSAISYHASQCQVNVMLVQALLSNPILNTRQNIRVRLNDPLGYSAWDQIKDHPAIGRVRRRPKLVVRHDRPLSAELASLSYPKLRSLIR